MAAAPALESVTLPPDAVELGHIDQAWGVQGWFKVLPYSAEAQALLASRRWYLQAGARSAGSARASFCGTLLLPIRQARMHAGTLIACAPGVADRDAATALRGARIFVPRCGFPPAAQDEYYWVDLIGLAVVNRQGVALGRVRELRSSGAQTLLVLDCAPPGGKPAERLIPFVSAFVDSVALADKRITVDWQPDY